ncbi:MAG: helix-turn-helix domain-containing protein [Thermodesulfovibrionales bacterium]
MRSEIKKQFMNYKELSEVLGVSEGSLRIWVMQGRIKPVRFGRCVRFSESCVKDLEEKGVPKNGNL